MNSIATNYSRETIKESAQNILTVTASHKSTRTREHIQGHMQKQKHWQQLYSDS